MKLKRLIVHGFKSFKDKTIINFDEGITGIVGPNGCGKSNIVDALFWVMGEQSAKHLRGNTMKDVIFAGSSKYKPASWAEVSLVLENTNGKHIHIGNKVANPSEIQLTRKLYRNGDSEYRINDNPCRLKDVQEVFMDTGAGAKSYSIIAQGEIDRLVKAKPVERRVMIEEVAGITKFKAKKRDSMRKIEQTQMNLNRLSDLQSEIEKNMRQLQKQAERAERAKNLKEKIKRNELVHSSHKVFEHLKTIKEANVEVLSKTSEIQEHTEEKNKLEESLVDERMLRGELVKKVDQSQKEYNELSKELAAAEEKLNYLCETQTSKESLLEEKESEVSELKSDLENRKTHLEELQNELKELEEKNKEQANFSEVEEALKREEEEVQKIEENLKAQTEEYESLREEFSKSEQEVYRVNNRGEELAATLQDLMTEIEDLEKEYSSFNAKVSEERDEVRELEELLSRVESQEKEISTEKDSLKEEYLTLENSLKSLNNSFIKTETYLGSLKDLQKSSEGSTELSQEFISNNSDNYSLAENILECDEEYVDAVEVALRSIRDLIISKDPSLENLESWLLDKESLNLNFLYKNTTSEYSESYERLSVLFDNNITPLVELVRVPDEYREQIKSLLSGYYIVENIEAISRGSFPVDVNFNAIISRNGKLMLKKQGQSVIKSHIDIEGLDNGAISRNNKISELSVELSEITEKKEKTESDFNEIEGKYLSLKEKHEIVREELLSLKEKFMTKKSAFDVKMEGFERGNRRLEILLKRKEEVSKARLDNLEEVEKLGKQKIDLEKKLTEKQEFKTSSFNKFEESKKIFQEKKNDFIEKQVEAKNFEERKGSFSKQIEDTNGLIERAKTKEESIGLSISQYKEEIEKIVSDIENLEKENLDKAKKVEEKNDVLISCKEELETLQKTMQKRESTVKDLTSNISKNEKDISKLEVSCSKSISEEEQVTKNIFEKYRIDLREAVGLALEYTADDFQPLNSIESIFTMETENGLQEISKEPYEFVRKYGQELKDSEVKFRQYKTEYNRLGEINWQAVADYDRQKLRFDFLKEQETELKQSLLDLELAINHIDEKSVERFRVAFKEVSSKFEKVFPLIFGGGNAELKLTSSLDDPECGVDIIAQPPGKKMQNINLMSGGEKALTAVSLIFSIFLVKPSPFCLLDEVDAPLDDANVGRFNDLLREMSDESQFILITHNKKTMELNDTLYGVTMQEPGISSALSVQLQ